MSHKSIAQIAIVMVIVFGGIVLLYPMMFHPEPATPPKAGAVENPPPVPVGPVPTPPPAAGAPTH